jgi:hypothetical protein
MPDENTQNQNGQQGGDDAEAQAKALDAKLNAIFTERMKRIEARQEKAISEAVAKAVAEITKAREGAGGNAIGDNTGNAGQAREGAQGGNAGQQSAQRADPEVVKLKEKLDQLERKNAESESRAKAVEEKARHDAMRAQVREALEAKGIKGTRAAAVLALLVEQKQLRFNDETGEPELLVTRPRAKGAKPETLAFGIKDGIEDWSKSPEADEFKPAAQIVSPGGTRRPLTTGARTSGPDGVPSDDALAEMFRKQGIDLNNV